MATYAVGDIQGCYLTFRRLLERIRFDPDADRLWVAGDMVNRGPASADVLRWMVDHHGAVTAVLGNHDIYLLRRAAGVAAFKGDTLTDVLEAPDRDALIAWVANRPLLVKEGAFVMVHAGILPRWSIDEAVARAGHAGRVLRSAESWAFLSQLGKHGRRPLPLRDDWQQAAETISILTMLRTVDETGEPHRAYKGPPAGAPKGCVPWFDAPKRKISDLTIVFGHWASLGYYRAPGIIGLDSGCSWGNVLTAVRLEDGKVFQEALADKMP